MDGFDWSVWGGGMVYTNIRERAIYPPIGSINTGTDRRQTSRENYRTDTQNPLFPISFNS